LFLKGPGCQIARFHVLGVDAPERPAAFEKDGMEPDGAIGTLSLYHADRKVGEGRIKTQLAAFAVAGAGLYVGRHSGEPITDDYPGEPRTDSPAAPSIGSLSTSAANRMSTWNVKPP
jgi:hypothetical protein